MNPSTQLLPQVNGVVLSRYPHKAAEFAWGNDGGTFAFALDTVRRAFELDPRDEMLVADLERLATHLGELVRDDLERDRTRADEREEAARELGMHRRSLQRKLSRKPSVEKTSW